MDGNVTEAAVEGVGFMAKILSEYGPFIGILAVFLVLFGFIIVTIMRNNQKQITSMIKQQEQHSQSIMNQNDKLVENMMEKEKAEEDEFCAAHRDFIKTYIDVQTVFKSASKHSQNKIGADRMGIYVFHNGNRSIHGLPFFKMSCVGEWLKTNVGAKKNIHSELPLYVYDDIILALYEDGYFENITNPSRESDMVSSFSVSSTFIYVFMLGIYDSNNNLAGFSIAEFKKKPEDITIEEIKESMQQLNDDISDIIIDSQLQERLRLNSIE